MGDFKRVLHQAGQILVLMNSVPFQSQKNLLYGFLSSLPITFTLELLAPLLAERIRGFSFRHRGMHRALACTTDWLKITLQALRVVEQKK